MQIYAAPVSAVLVETAAGRAANRELRADFQWCKTRAGLSSRQFEARDKPSIDRNKTRKIRRFLILSGSHEHSEERLL
jgi:hypothetical protein